MLLETGLATWQYEPGEITPPLKLLQRDVRYAWVSSFGELINSLAIYGMVEFHMY